MDFEKAQAEARRRWGPEAQLQMDEDVNEWTRWQHRQGLNPHTPRHTLVRGKVELGRGFSWDGALRRAHLFVVRTYLHGGRRAWPPAKRWRDEGGREAGVRTIAEWWGALLDASCATEHTRAMFSAVLEGWLRRQVQAAPRRWWGWLEVDYEPRGGLLEVMESVGLPTSSLYCPLPRKTRMRIDLYPYHMVCRATAGRGGREELVWPRRTGRSE